ncbi:MAG: MBL fold metallo-hydrolase [Eubacteriales bacterium]
MLKQILPNIYLNEIPLPNSPLRVLNSYIISSENRTLIIDAGFNTKECKKAFLQGIEEIGVALSSVDLLITHMHVDHSGLAVELNKNNMNILTGKTDGKLMNKVFINGYKEGYWEFLELSNLNKYFKSERLSKFTKDPAFNIAGTDPIKYQPLIEGEEIIVGEYKFKVVDIPGHTPGHIGLYEEKHRLFFGGDHVLDQISPNITIWNFEQDIISEYLNSLKKVYDLDVDYLFAGHRNIIRDHRRRINEIIEHHHKRLEEIKEIVMKGRKSVIDIAAEMKWDIKFDDWEDFPPAQKYFAAGEAMAHLEHLVFKGEVARIKEKGIFYYSLKNQCTDLLACN